MIAAPASGVRLEWVNERLLPFDSRFLTTCGHTIHYVNEGRRSGTPAPPRQCNVVSNLTSTTVDQTSERL